MKYNVVFWELDINLAKSMDDFLSKEIERLDEEFPGIIFNKTKKNRPNSNRFVIRCADGKRIDLILSCYLVYDEREAIDNSDILLNKDKYAKLLSVINLGSTYFKYYKKHDLLNDGIKMYDKDHRVDDIIIKKLEEKNIGVLFTNCIHSFKYSRPEYMLDRVEVYDKVDNAWPAPDCNRHISSLINHKDEIDDNLYVILYSLLTSNIINSQMLGELIYKAVYPKYWKEYVETCDKEVGNRYIDNRPVFTDNEKLELIRDVNNIGVINNQVNAQDSSNVALSFDEFIGKNSNENDIRPDVDSLIYEKSDEKDSTRRR